MLGKFCVFVEFFVFQGVDSFILRLVVLLVDSLGGLLHAHHEVLELFHSFCVVLVLVSFLLRELILHGMLISWLFLVDVCILWREIAYLLIFDLIGRLLLAKHKTLVPIQLDRWRFNIDSWHSTLLAFFLSISIL